MVVIVFIIGDLVFDIDPSIMPDWAKDSTLICSLNANLMVSCFVIVVVTKIKQH
jgi:hypothetical protein